MDDNTTAHENAAVMDPSFGSMAAVPGSRIIGSSARPFTPVYETFTDPANVCVVWVPQITKPFT